MKITKKSYKFGTYATSEFRVNGVLVGEINMPERNCGTSWFMDLPSEEDAEEEEIALYQFPLDRDILNRFLDDDEDDDC